MKHDLDAKIENLPNVSSPVDSADGNISKTFLFPQNRKWMPFMLNLVSLVANPLL